MKLYEIIGYTYNAGVHCLGCAVQSGMDKDDVLDDEGNEPHPMFAGDENSDNCVCDTCKEELIW